MRILMTGGGSSVGNYIRERLIEQGHRVVSVGLTGPDFEMDFSDGPNEILDALEDYWDSWEEKTGGPFDVLINNAAITRIDFTSKHHLSDFLKVLHVDLVAPWLFVREFVSRIERGMDPAHVRRIISTSSMGTKTSLRGSPGYCAAKSGLEALTRMWAREFAGVLPIMTCAIAPGPVEGTAMQAQCVDELIRTRHMSREEAEAYTIGSPLGRKMGQDELWKVFDFAVNDMPEYMSGTVLYCTGGSGL